MSDAGKKVWAPGSVQLAPIPFDQVTQVLFNRLGGTQPLPVRETVPGIYTSAWVINKKARRLLGRPHALTLVVDTNVPGHPSVSMVVQPINLVKG